MRLRSLLCLAGSAAALLLAPASCGGDSGDSPGDTPPGSLAESGAAPGSEGGTPASDAPSGSDAPLASCGKPGKPGDTTVTITSGGKPRTFLLHVPAKYDGSKAVPLVFVFHGYTMTADGIEKASHFVKTADARGWIAAFPQGIGNSFNAGDCCGQAVTDNVDDVAFTKDMIAKIGGEYCVDPKRTYETGFSNGGFFSYKLACELADVIAAVAPVSGGLRIDAAACKPKRPIALLHIHGTNDVVVPYNGGGLGAAKPVTESIDAMKTKNGCPAGAGKVVFSKGDTSCTKWDGCTAGADVELCTVTGGGHQWPGGDKLPYGETLSTDLNASETIADFFEAHPLP